MSELFLIFKWVVTETDGCVQVFKGKQLQSVCLWPHTMVMCMWILLHTVAFERCNFFQHIYLQGMSVGEAIELIKTLKITAWIGSCIWARENTQQLLCNGKARHFETLIFLVTTEAIHWSFQSQTTTVWVECQCGSNKNDCFVQTYSLVLKERHVWKETHMVAHLGRMCIGPKKNHDSTFSQSIDP